MEYCKYRVNSKCFAFHCHNKKKCGGRNEQGKPNYATLREVMIRAGYKSEKDGRKNKKGGGMDKYFQIEYSYSGRIRIKAKDREYAEEKIRFMDEKELYKGLKDFNYDSAAEEIEKETYDNSKKDEVFNPSGDDKVRLIVYVPVDSNGEITTRKEAEEHVEHLSSIQPENHCEIKELD